MKAKSTNCRARRLGYDSPTSDTKCQHRSSCTLTSSQPLIRSYESFMHHTRAKNTFVLSWSISYSCTRVWKRISSMNCHWRAHRRSRRTFVQQPCVHSVMWNWRTTRYDIMHMWQVNTPQGMERYVTSKLDSTSAPVVPSAIYNLPSIRRTIDYQSTSTMGRTTISHSSWSSSQLIQPLVTPWKSFQPPRTRKCRSNTMAFNSRTHWSSSAVHPDPLWLRHSEATSICTCTPNNNYASTVNHEVNNGVTNTSICWHGKNQCSTVS